MLPFEVELELYTLYDITRDILVLTLVSIVMYYGSTRSSRDETWVEQKFASFFTLSLLTWLALTFVIPFSVLSFLHPDLILEIGGHILNQMSLAIAMLLIIIIIIQALHYKGYFKTKK